MGKANGFLLDAFAWAGMSTFVHDDVFNKGVHPVGNITTKIDVPEYRELTILVNTAACQSCFVQNDLLLFLRPSDYID